MGISEDNTQSSRVGSNDPTWHKQTEESFFSTEEEGYPDGNEQHAKLLVAAGEEKDKAITQLLDGTKLSEVTIENGGRDEKRNLPPIRTLLALSVSFNLAYTAFNGIQNLQSSLNQTDGLGLITIAVVYGVNPLASPLGPTVLRIFGGKTVLLLSWTGMAVFIASNFYSSFYTLIPGAAIFGLLCASAGTSSIMYTTAISDSYAARNKLGPERRHNVLSIVNGVFYTFWEATQVTGNLISSLVLSSNVALSNDNYVTETGVCGSVICPTSIMNTTAITQPAQETVYILFGIFLACVLAGFLVTAIFLPPIHTSVIRQTVFQGYVSCYKMFLDKRCTLLVPLFFAQATMMMFLCTGFTKAYITCTLGVGWVGFIMMVFGASTAICATAVNSLSRFLDRKVLIIAFIVIDSSVLVTLLLWDPAQENSIIILFSIAALAGVSQGISQAQFNALISTVFKDNLVPAFVAYTVTKTFASAFSLGVSNFACTYHRLYMTLALYALGFTGYMVTEFSLYRKNKLLIVA